MTEYAAITFSLIYFLLAAKGNIWCWLAGFTSTFLNTFIFIYLQIDSQVMLNIVYMIMAVYGWMCWLTPLSKHKLSVFTPLSIKQNMHILLASLFFTLLVSFFATSWFGEDYAYIEAWLFVISLVASVLTIYRVIESWLYWLLINSISLVIYWNINEISAIGFFLSGMLLSIYGFINWRRYYSHDCHTAQFELVSNKSP